MICSHLFIRLWEVRGRLIKSHTAGCSNSVLSFTSMTQMLDGLEESVSVNVAVGRPLVVQQ